LISFIPYLGSLSGLVISTCVAIAQFWPDWTWILLVPAIFFVGHPQKLRASTSSRRSEKK
jgi:predicted PurR-regulated permease PerM